MIFIIGVKRYFFFYFKMLFDLFLHILFDIYAESEEKLDFAIKALDVWYPVEFQRVLLGEVS